MERAKARPILHEWSLTENAQNSFKKMKQTMNNNFNKIFYIVGLDSLHYDTKLAIFVNVAFGPLVLLFLWMIYD